MTVAPPTVTVRAHRRRKIIYARKRKAARASFVQSAFICSSKVSACNRDVLATCNGMFALSDRFISSDGVACVDTSHTFSGSSYRLIWSDVSHLVAWGVVLCRKSNVPLVTDRQYLH